MTKKPVFETLYGNLIIATALEGKRSPNLITDRRSDGRLTLLPYIWTVPLVRLMMSPGIPQMRDTCNRCRWANEKRSHPIAADWLYGRRFDSRLRYHSYGWSVPCLPETRHTDDRNRPESGTPQRARLM